MDFRILGSLEVWDGERQLELGGPKRRAVLAYLLLHANEVVGIERLVDQLWGEKAPRNAAAALHNHVSRLRKELGHDLIATRAWGYVLRSEPGAVDFERFARLVAEAENLPARERAARLREALALWRGAPLEDLASEPAFSTEIGRLEELRATVLENRIDADLEAGKHNGIISELEALIAEHPLRERLRGQLILALYRSGRQAEALEVYRETRRVLAEELGLEPSPEPRELERAILQHDPSLRPATPPGPPVIEQSIRPGRRRRLYITAATLLLAAGAGAAGLALSTGGGRVQRPSLSPVESVTHHRAASVTAVRPHRSGQEATPAAPQVATDHRRAKTAIVPDRPVRPSSRSAGSAPAGSPRHATPASKAVTTTANPPQPSTSTTQSIPVTIADAFDGSQIR